MYDTNLIYCKTCVKWLLKNRQNEDLNDKWWHNEGRKYCRMLPLEHSAIPLTCIKRKLVLKTNLIFFESGRFFTRFTVYFFMKMFRYGILLQLQTT